MAKKYPTCYVEHKEMAQGLHEKELKKGPKAPIILPDDYVNHDGSDEHDWNLEYMRLIEYYNKNGDCNIPVRDESGLGKFVMRMRAWYRAKCAFLTPRRSELLEEIKFAWVADPNRRQHIPGGCPRFNKSIAAKLVYPQLSIREALYLGGHTDDEMDVKVDPKHTWRTAFVILKDKLNSKVKHWESLQLQGSKKKILHYVDILKSNKAKKHEVVFGKNADLLVEFLNEADEREAIDIIKRDEEKARKLDEVDRLDQDEQSVPKEEHEQSVPKDEYEQSVPNDQYEQSVPNDQYEQHIHKDQYEQSLPKGQYDQSALKDQYSIPIPQGANFPLLDGNASFPNHQQLGIESNLSQRYTYQ